MSSETVRNYIAADPTRVTHWRSVVLFGVNSACYKFAFGKSILDVASAGRDSIRLEELALPYAKHVCTHLEASDRQTPQATSRFLDACRSYLRTHKAADLSASAPGATELIDTTVRLGFTEVLKAFHTVAGDDVPTRFFSVEGRGGDRRLLLSPAALSLSTDIQGVNLSHEIEARWRLVETAWAYRLPKIVLDGTPDAGGMLTIELPDRRRPAITGCREALNGYQRGRCFYCARDIVISAAHVDHFLPRTLMVKAGWNGLDGLWNLVLACVECNLAKRDRIPHPDYVRRLLGRTNYLLASHHPLSQTLVEQTGRTEAQRDAFVGDRWRAARDLLHHAWKPNQEIPAPW